MARLTLCVSVHMFCACVFVYVCSDHPVTRQGGSVFFQLVIWYHFWHCTSEPVTVMPQQNAPRCQGQINAGLFPLLWVTQDTHYLKEYYFKSEWNAYELSKYRCELFCRNDLQMTLLIFPWHIIVTIVILETICMPFLSVPWGFIYFGWNFLDHWNKRSSHQLLTNVPFGGLF